MSERGPGRPRLCDVEETVRLQILVSAGDREMVRRAAERAGVSMSQYVRDAVLVMAAEELGLDPANVLDR